MKNQYRILFIALIASFMIGYTQFSQAQVSKGTVVVGGGLQFSTTKSEEGTNSDLTTTSFAFVPSAGFFVADRFAVGLDLLAATDKSKYQVGNTTSTTKQTQLGVGPFARYYLPLGGESFYFIAQAGFNVAPGKIEQPVYGATITTKSNTFNVYLSPGITYFFNKKWAAELTFSGLSYETHDPNKDADDDKENTFTFGVNSLQPSLGVRIYF